MYVGLRRIAASQQSPQIVTYSFVNNGDIYFLTEKGNFWSFCIVFATVLLNTRCSFDIYYNPIILTFIR